MIVGSIYLGKQAKKAYRKRQAEKAAQKLTAPYDIADPSDEIKLRVPPSSPTGSTQSLTSTPSNDLASITSSDLGRIKSSRSSTDLAYGLSASSSLSRPRSNTGGDAPPSYEAIAGSGPTSQPRTRPSHNPHSSQHSLDQSPQSGYPSWSSPNAHYNHCPECFAMMQQQMHQMHMHGHHQPFAPPIHTHSTGAMHNPPQVQYHSPVMPGAAEMPDPSVYQRQPHTEASRPIAEAPDTGTYSATSGPIFEMPAELPSGFGAPAQAEKTEDEQDKQEDNYAKDMVKSDSSVAVSRESEDCDEDTDNFSFRPGEVERTGGHLPG